MEKILILTHCEPTDSLNKAALEAIGAGLEIQQSMPGSELALGFIGADCQGAANAAANCGAKRFLSVTGADFAQSRYSTDSAAAEELIRASGASVVIAPATARWNRVLPGVSRRVNGQVDTHVTGIGIVEGKLQVSRWYYRQRMEAALSRAQRPWILLVEPGTHAAWAGAAGTANVENLTVILTDAHRRTEVVGLREPASDVQTIRPEAKLLLVAGAGWTKKQADGQAHVKEAEKLISDCLRLTRGSLGSTKSLVDLGGEGLPVLSFLTHLNQVGQTGSTPRHPKGLATCCHGEEPHTVGWRFIGERRAVNMDPNCGWARGKADVLYVADAFAVVTALNQLLSASPNP